MDNTKVDMFIIANAKFFPTDKITMVKERLEKMDNDKFTLF